MKVEECFGILKEKITNAENENKNSFDKNIDGVEIQEKELNETFTRTIYTLDDGVIFLFLKYELNGNATNPSYVIKSVNMYAKNSDQNDEIHCGQDLSEIYSFQKKWD